MSAIRTVAGAVTVLFVPGDRPDRYAKAATSGADVIILDLEDAVAPAAKTAARRAVTGALRGTGEPLRALVRVNAAGAPAHDDDVGALVDLASRPGHGLLGVMLPKADDPRVITEVIGRLHAADPELAVVPLVESAAGVLRAPEIAGVPGVTRLALGAIDLTADVDAELDSPIVTHAMAQLVLASRAAGIAPPVDSPATEIRDTAVVAATARAARGCGFGGKLCIHPAQLDPVRTAFHPSPEQIAWAQRVLAAGDSAVQVDGKMVDRPVVLRAGRILRRAAGG